MAELPESAAECRDEGRQRRQAKGVVALALAAGKTVKQAAAAADVGTRSVYRWLKQPGFNRRIARYRSAMVRAAAGQLADCMSAAIGSLRQLLGDDSATVRLRAADLLLSHCVRVQETADVLARLEQIEHQLADGHQPAGAGS